MAGRLRRWAARTAVAVLVLVLVLAGLAGCTGDPDPGAGARPPDSPTVVPRPADPSPTPPSSAGPPTTPPPRAPRATPDDARVAVALRAVRTLAGVIGPRPAPSAAYDRAAGWVTGELRRHGWDVRRQSFPVPAGVSWGVPVGAGRSVNLVATRGSAQPGRPVRSGRPWLLVGAHLDTVPQAPGAEDNASGVGVLLAVAEALATSRSRLPVVLVAFGAEEPRGPGDDDHHFGSRAYVAALPPAQRRTLRGAVSLDRVGVGDALVVGSAEEGDPLRAELVAAARSAGVPTVVESGQRSSDHWSFVRAGLPGVRLGSTPYAAYHSAADVPSVVQPAQLERAVRTVLAWVG